MTTIEEMTGMDVLCNDKSVTLFQNKLTVDKYMIEGLEIQDAIDGAIVAMLSDLKEARAGIKEIHFLPFYPTDKRTALKYLDGAGKMHRESKDAPEQILHLADNKSEIEQRVHANMDKSLKVD
ncbi:hypothetical protein Ddye_004171 [Dipteronia dyeriana]|uniref:Uncharacterized protein n=1 Tax=Dipteronia dyeriana TaxID=168575 RepID=A0AAD9XUW1_9ROSI|nr:hypothetical protein Ddye_004171 [Dipteronia dyeriana]